MPLAAGQSLSYYEILAPLGASAMGEVWRARDTRLDREVAIKVLPEHFAEDEERLWRFEREAKSLASLKHPDVAQVFGIDQVGDRCFIAMELVPGMTLQDRICRRAFRARGRGTTTGSAITGGIASAIRRCRRTCWTWRATRSSCPRSR